MSDETNDTLNNDEPMEINEIESSIENEIVEAKTYGSMSSSEFEAKLTAFFKKHQKSKLRFVKRIATEFAGHEQEVLDHLHNRFVLGEPSAKELRKLGIKKKATTKAIEGVPNEKKSKNNKDEKVEVAKPKSKKKLIIIIVLVVILAGGGTAVFLLKDKLFGGKHGTEHAAEGHDDKAKTPEAGAEKPKEETPAPATTDSTATPATDSAATAATTPANETPAPAH